MMWYYLDFPFMGFGMLLSLVFLAAVIYFFIWLIRKLENEQNKFEESPLDILKRRYAKGELTKKQYEEVKKDIE